MCTQVTDDIIACSRNLVSTTVACSVKLDLGFSGNFKVVHGFSVLRKWFPPYPAASPCFKLCSRLEIKRHENINH